MNKPFTLFSGPDDPRLAGIPDLAVKATAAPLPTPPRGYFFFRSREQRSPDRAASIARRRMHALCGALPPQLGQRLTVGEQAVCRIIADEFLAHGICDRSRNELGARAGVCQKLAERTVRKIEKLGWIKVERRPRSGRKHLTNLTSIVSPEWLTWLAHGNRKAKAIQHCQKARPDFPTVRGDKNFPPRSQGFKSTVGTSRGPNEEGRGSPGKAQSERR